MKKLSINITLVAIIGHFSCINAQEKNYSIQGTLTDPALEGKKIILTISNYNDTTVLVNHRFSFNSVKNIGKARIELLNHQEKNFLSEYPLPQSIQFFVDGTKTELTGNNFDDVRVSENILQKEYQVILNNIEFVLKNSLELNQIQKWKKSNEVILSYMENNPNSLVSQQLFDEFITVDHMKSFRIANNHRFSQVYDAFPNQYKETSIGKLQPMFLEADAKIIKIGQFAPEFTLTSSLGKQINLSDYSGKYIYLDFWASWCKGCRLQHPLLRRLHETYKNKNFEIISVSLDSGPNAKDKWLKAITDDKLTWTQVSDLSFRPPIQKAYGFLTVPMNFLIDPDGKILAHNLHGEYLENYLRTLFLIQ